MEHLFITDIIHGWQVDSLKWHKHFKEQADNNMEISPQMDILWISICAVQFDSWK